MEKALFEQIKSELRLASEGEPASVWGSPRWECSSRALRLLFEDGCLSDRARERVLIRLGLACASLVLQRQRAAALCAAAEMRAKRYAPAPPARGD